MEGRKEQDHVVGELGSEELIVVKDYKWQDTANTNNLYYLAIAKDLSIRSLRDLRGDVHLMALRRVRDEIVSGLASKHAVPSSQLLAYAHYHPSFWYFHVHIVSCKHDMFSGDGSQNLLLNAMERFHKVDVIIALLEANAGHFRDAQLPILLPPQQLPWYDEAEPLAKRAKVT